MPGKRQAGQDRAAAERRASLERGPAPAAAPPLPGDDQRPIYAVEVLDAGGQLLRGWHCRLTDAEAKGTSVRMRRVQP